MSGIDEHVVHDGRGKTRTTRCRHCSKLFTSRSKDRWRQHMRGCDSLPPELRHLFSSSGKPYARLSLSPSEAASEAPVETPASPAPSSESDSAPSTPVTPTPGVTSSNVTEVTEVPAAGTSSPSDENSLRRAVGPVASSAAASATGFLADNPEKMTEILLVHGPCSFMRSAWTGGNSGDVAKADLMREVQNLAVEQEISLVTHESNHEGTILDWLLNAKENEIIVLCWVGRLSDSPTVVRALGLTKNRVIIISPRGVDHGALPATVVGVLSGFGQLSFSLALAAAKNLNARQCL